MRKSLYIGALALAVIYLLAGWLVSAAINLAVWLVPEQTPKQINFSNGQQVTPTYHLQNACGMECLK